MLVFIFFAQFEKGGIKIIFSRLCTKLKENNFFYCVKIAQKKKREMFFELPFNLEVLKQGSAKCDL